VKGDKITTRIRKKEKTKASVPVFDKTKKNKRTYIFKAIIVLMCIYSSRSILHYNTVPLFSTDSRTFFNVTGSVEGSENAGGSTSGGKMDQLRSDRKWTNRNSVYSRSQRIYCR